MNDFNLIDVSLKDEPKLIRIIRLKHCPRKGEMVSCSINSEEYYIKGVRHDEYISKIDLYVVPLSNYLKDQDKDEFYDL